jgi:hypothetical protein
VYFSDSANSAFDSSTRFDVKDAAAANEELEVLLSVISGFLLLRTLTETSSIFDYSFCVYSFDYSF